MAKYIFAITLLAFLAFENININKRFYVESLPSVRAETAAYPRDHQQYKEHLDKLYASHRQQQQQYQHSNHHHHHHRHKRIHHENENENQKQKQINHHEQNPIKSRKIVKRHNSLDLNILNKNNEINDELTKKHIQRHQQHQLEHLQHHQEHYHHQKQSDSGLASTTLSSSIESNENLKTMPRPWQHLSKYDDMMFGDEPYKKLSNEEIEETPLKQILDISNLNNEAEDDFIESLSMEENLIPNDSMEKIELPPEPSSLSSSSSSSETDSIEEQSLEEESDSSKKPKKSHHRCPKCEVQRQVEHITEEELTRLRIEFVKNQILEKLRLKERPNVSAVALPKPLQEGVTIDQGDETAKNKELDDYYARTNKKFIFLERETNKCKQTNVPNSICFSFKIDDADADGFDVNTAVLWIFKRNLKNKLKLQTQTSKSNNNNNNNNNTLINHEDIVVYEVQPPEDEDFQSVSKTIAIKRVDKNVSDKWLEIHIEWPIQRWFGNHDLSHLIQISCESCDINDIEEMISIDKDYRPFIMIDTQNRRRVSRQKRSINCTDGVTECCREKLYISFEEIGWGDWIIQPRGYDAYFCRGSCGTVASVAQSSSHHSTFLQKVIAMNRGKGRKPLELIPCCTAKQYSSLQLVFMDTNNTATQKTFPNMVIESCGCR